jgi:hypothetical protein
MRTPGEIVSPLWNEGNVDAAWLVFRSKVFVAALVSVGQMDRFANEKVSHNGGNVDYQCCQHTEKVPDAGSMCTYAMFRRTLLERSRFESGLYLACDVLSPPIPSNDDILKIPCKLKLKVTRNLGELKEPDRAEQQPYVITWVRWAERRSSDICRGKNLELTLDRTENLFKSQDIGGVERKVTLAQTLSDGMRVAHKDTMRVPFTTRPH